MFPLNIWDNQFIFKELYIGFMEPVCEKYGLSRTEFAILMFLSNNPRFDTAADIVEVRHLAKSHVSVSLKHMEELGYIERGFADGNRKTVHITVCEKAGEIVRDGRRAQELFMNTMLEDIPEGELNAACRCAQRMLLNAQNHLNREKGDI